MGHSVAVDLVDALSDAIVVCVRSPGRDATIVINLNTPDGWSNVSLDPGQARAVGLHLIASADLLDGGKSSPLP
jgi:hypothetical protein